jgi:hypothetical protein
MDDDNHKSDWISSFQKSAKATVVWDRKIQKLGFKWEQLELKSVRSDLYRG